MNTNTSSTDPGTNTTAAPSTINKKSNKFNHIKYDDSDFTKLLTEFGYTDPANLKNPDSNPAFNNLLSKVVKDYKQFGLPQAPRSVTEPAFGEKSINDIATLYQKVYLPAIDNYSRSHVGDKDILKLLRFFGLIQLIIFRSLSMVDMYSLLRSKYDHVRVKKMLDGVTDILGKLENKGLEVKSYTDQINSYKKIIGDMAPGIKPIVVATPGSVASVGGGKKSTRGRKATKSRKATKGKKVTKATKSKKIIKTPKRKGKSKRSSK